MQTPYAPRRVAGAWVLAGQRGIGCGPAPGAPAPGSPPGAAQIRTAAGVFMDRSRGTAGPS
ncbi:hypothetical protein [Mycobacterium sp.]|uniref:hypothetical protein n=1 Tax=Mycobacterium sp. TaxID=1785 RepID=UPI0031D241CB